MQRWSLWIWLLESDGFGPWCQGVPSSSGFLHDRTGSAIVTRERGGQFSLCGARSKSRNTAQSHVLDESPCTMHAGQRHQ